MTVVVRFAPSPTGFLHVGNIRKALLNYLYAKKNGGTFFLRYDDTDHTRVEPKFTEAINEDLEWLGLKPDQCFFQSKRLDRYQAAIEQLKAVGRLYPCYETPEELAFKRKIQLARGLPPQYDQSALRLTPKEIKALEDKGLKPHWRFRLEPGPIEWEDLTRGLCHFEGEHLSDPILLRENGDPVYSITSAVDDIELGVTHIIRGEDHVSNTAVQCQIIKALGVDPKRFTFAHLPLIMDESGQKFSKRLGSLSIQTLREQHTEPMAILSYLETLGTPHKAPIKWEHKDLVQAFDLKNYSRASPKFSLKRLMQINREFYHTMPYETAKVRFQSLSPFKVDFWHLVQNNIEEKVEEVYLWHDILCQPLATITSLQKLLFLEEDQKIIQAAHDLLPAPPWTQDSWTTWIQGIKEKTGQKGKVLFMPIRMALTGLSHGPQLKDILYFLDHDAVKERLSAAAQKKP